MQGQHFAAAALAISAYLAFTTVPAGGERVWHGPSWEVVREARYHPTARRLRLELASGHVYLYREVPPECFDGFLVAERKGIYYNRFIRHCFPSARLSL